MEILGSKKGSINKIGTANMIKKNGKDLTKQQFVPKSDLIKAIDGKIDILRDQSTLELEKKEEERNNRIKKAFQEWVEKDHVTDFKNHSVVNPNHSIVKLFYYREDATSSSLILPEGLESFYKVYPVGIVVSICTDTQEDLMVGDFIRIHPLMCKTVQSKEWEQYQMRIREQPSLKQEFPEPPSYIGKLNEWASYLYQKDIFSDITIEDQHTFCLPNRLIQSIDFSVKLNSNGNS